MNQQMISICQNHDFRRVYSRGKSYVTPAVVIYVLKNRTGRVRFGITTSKKIGNAVLRNRSRRIIKEAWRQIFPFVRPGCDYIFVARGKTPYLKMQDVKKHMQQQLGKAGFYQES